MAKKDLAIGENPADEVEEFKDPWLEEDKKSKPKGSGKGKKGGEGGEEGSSTQPETAQSTAALAAQVAQKMQEEQASHAQKMQEEQGVRAPIRPLATSVVSSDHGAVVPPPPNAPPPPKRSEQELEEQAQKMAEETLANVPEEVREKQLPKIKEKIKARLLKEQETAAAMPPAPPPKPPPPNMQSPLMQALPAVPGVIGGAGPNMLNSSPMVGRVIEQLQNNMMIPSLLPTTADAENRAAVLQGTATAAIPPGMFLEELEINDYPQVARQKITHRDPLLAIEELTGSKCWVKGQYFPTGSTLPPGARRLYVEILGPTKVQAQKAKTEVLRMMEALAIRTLNIPGASRAVMGTPGKYDPMVGK